MTETSVLLIVELTNGFRAWGAAAALFAMPALRAFLPYAFRRGRTAARAGGWFLGGLWRAGRETTLQSNAWIIVALFAFLVAAGVSIFVSSNFLRGYGEPALQIVMLPAWAMLSAAGWAATIQTASRPGRMAMAGGIVLAVMLCVALSLEARA